MLVCAGVFFCWFGRVNFYQPSSRLDDRIAGRVSSRDTLTSVCLSIQIWRVTVTFSTAKCWCFNHRKKYRQPSSLSIQRRVLQSIILGLRNGQRIIEGLHPINPGIHSGKRRANNYQDINSQDWTGCVVCLKLLPVSKPVSQCLFNQQ